MKNGKKSRLVLPRRIRKVLKEHHIPLESVGEVADCLALVFQRYDELKNVAGVLQKRAGCLAASITPEKVVQFFEKVDLEKNELEAQLAQEKEARKLERESGADVVEHQANWVRRQNELIDRLNDMVSQLQVRVRELLEMDANNIERIRFLAEHLELSTDPTWTPEKKELLSVMKALDSRKISRDWFVKAHSDPIDTAPLPVIQGE